MNYITWEKKSKVFEKTKVCSLLFSEGGGGYSFVSTITYKSLFSCCCFFTRIYFLLCRNSIHNTPTIQSSEITSLTLMNFYDFSRKLLIKFKKICPIYQKQSDNRKKIFTSIFMKFHFSVQSCIYSVFISKLRQ